MSCRSTGCCRRPIGSGLGTPVLGAVMLCVAVLGAGSLGVLGCNDTEPAVRQQGAASQGAASQGAIAQQDKRVQVAQWVFLGDSLTAGYGLEKSEAVPALIAARLRAEGLPYRVINAGRSGDTTAGGLSRLDWYFQPPANIAVLVIGLGSNDAMRGLSLQAMEDNLRKIVQIAKKKAPSVKIFLWGMQTFPNLGPQYVKDYAAVFPRVAEQTGAILIPFPLTDVAGNVRFNQADGIHPNREGAVRVADRIWAVVKPHT